MDNFLIHFLRETAFLFLEISPYLLLGFFFAGVIHTLVGERYIRKHFARSGLLSTVKATIMGIPLPICSCGVIPLAESLRKDGASKSSVMAFLVSTPSSGVDSILATYALMGPVFAVFRPLASLFSGILVGAATHFSCNGEDPAPPVSGEDREKRRFRDVFSYGFRVLPSEIAQWLLIGVAAGGLISALVPADFASSYLTTPFLHYGVVLLISVPLYVCATGSIPIAASLLMKGILPGAVLAFLIAGPATNTVTLSFVTRRLGKKVAAIYLVTIIITSVGLGILFDLLAPGVTGMAAGVHVHAEDDTGLIKLISGFLMLLILLNSRIDLARIFRKGKGAPHMEVIKVNDISCNHCRMTLMKSLKEIPGIGTLDVRVDEKSVVYDGDAAPELIREEIRKAGYTPE